MVISYENRLQKFGSMLIGVGKNENAFILMKHRSQLRQLLEMPKAYSFRPSA